MDGVAVESGIQDVLRLVEDDCSVSISIGVDSAIQELIFRPSNEYEREYSQRKGAIALGRKNEAALNR